MRLRLLGCVAAGAVLALTACSSGGSTPRSASSTAAAATCAWRTRADKTTLNIAYPDTSATYWGIRYALAPGQHLEVAGTFPAARYASFVTYEAGGGAIDVLTDRDIDRDAGSVNPFRTPITPSANKMNRNYTVEIRPDTGATATATANVLGAAPPAGSPATSTTTTTRTGTERQVILGGGGRDAVEGTVLYRVYVPDDASDPTGGTGLPAVRLVDPAGHTTKVPTCTHPGRSQAAIDIVNHLERKFAAAPPAPIFIRPQAGQLNLYPNPDNVYVATIIAYQPGRIVVVRGRAPTFPDTRRGTSVTSDTQVRFWSMCTNQVRKPYPVTACAADDATKLDPAGFYTYVISTPADRPGTTPATTESTWLDWGNTKVDGLLLLRNMLARPTFAEATNSVAPGALATSTMGEYAPRGAYCAKATFEQGGATACGL